MQNRIYSLVLDPKGHFPLQAQRLVKSMSHFAGIKKEQIYIHVAGEPSDQILKSIKKLQVQIISVEPYKNHPYCNKLQQLRSLEGKSFSDVVLLDCDTIVLEEPPNFNGGVLGKPVDFDNPPTHIIENIFNKAGVEIKYMDTDVNRKPTVFANVNGGVYVICSSIYSKLISAWEEWASWCMENIELFEDRFIHVDQVSFAMAITSTGIDFQELNRRYNCPTHMKQPQDLDCHPAILHYHSAVNDQQMLLEVSGLNNVNVSIKKINEWLLSNRRKRFDNATFWDARYTNDPGIGSGIGSRGSFLQTKQELLQKISKAVMPISIFDVGGGDGFLTSCLDENIPIDCWDISKSSESIYTKNVPHANWFEKDICENKLSDTRDLCICFDLLIHISENSKYLNAVNNLARSAQVLLVSGFDAKPVEFGSMTYFHEPLSVTLENVGLSAIPIGAYRGLVLFLAFDPSNLSSAKRNISKETLSSAINFVDHPIELVISIFKAIQTIGFFPNHLPRCIEYPWIASLITPDKPLRILDAGAGVSVLPILLAEMGHSVITVDNSSEVRTRTNQMDWNEWGFLDYAEINENINSLNMPYEETGFKGELDVVISVSVIEHLPSSLRQCWLEKACMQLTSGGRLILTVDTYPFSDNLWNFSEGVEVEDPATHGTVDDLVAEINNSGMVVSELGRSNWLPKSRVGMVRIEAYKK